MSNVLALQHVQQAYRARKIIWLLSALFLAIIIWASLATLDQVVVAEGKVVPSQSVQQIQSLEGGIISSFNVQLGETVTAGQLLLSLDNTRFNSAFEETEQSMTTLKQRQQTLSDLLQSVLLTPEADRWQQVITVTMLQSGAVSDAYLGTMRQLNNQLSTAAENIYQQQQRLAEANSNSASLTASKQSLDEETALITAMVDEGVVAEVERLQLERQQIELQGQIDASLLIQQQLSAAVEQAVRERLDIALTFRAQQQQELDQVEAELARLSKNQLAVADALKRTEMRSPVNGIVKDIYIRSLQGVVQPGEAILDIVPLDDNLLVEASVKPQDIAYLSLGLEAMVKFTAFDFVIYGGLPGELIHISPDALQQEDGSTFYKVLIKTNDTQFGDRPLIPGMQASVDILTGRKTVLSYWLKPFLRARATALREH
ncbi:MAG: HlyD family type I secretion periplasmic adaptor subunit [Pseudomonadales bacterium]|nr:HlyD family type I secretion periplasmic adaptor subunit [Pseudomonadales bacterium]